MDWIVFADDWGVHPSTTQHLVLNLPATDRVIWLDSVGMRQPRLRIADAKRMWDKSRRFFWKTAAENQLYEGRGCTLERIKPKVIPWHLNPLAIRFNIFSLGRAIRRRTHLLSMRDPVLLVSYPVAAQYLEAFPCRKVAYLRLDDYAMLPGADLELVLRTEQVMVDRADVVFATAKSLLPGDALSTKAHYLPQGVDCDHFARVPLDPPGRKVLGFFGRMAEWMDFELIEKVARSAPEWQLEFIGPVRYRPKRLASIPNVRFLPAMPFDMLPQAISSWTAAWIPFEVSEFTVGVNPLKAREYLAAGLAILSTPLPEVASLPYDIAISDDPQEVVTWMEEVFADDSPKKRSDRRASVQQDSWVSRCAQMRRVMEGVG